MQQLPKIVTTTQVSKPVTTHAYQIGTLVAVVDAIYAALHIHTTSSTKTVAWIVADSKALDRSTSTSGHSNS